MGTDFKRVRLRNLQSYPKHPINLLFMFLLYFSPTVWVESVFCAPQNIPAFIKNSLEINLVPLPTFCFVLHGEEKQRDGQMFGQIQDSKAVRIS